MMIVMPTRSTNSAVAVGEWRTEAERVEEALRDESVRGFESDRTVRVDLDLTTPVGGARSTRCQSAFSIHADTLICASIYVIPTVS